MKFVYKKGFLRQFSSYSVPVQELILETDRQIKVYLKTQTAPYGLRIRKIGPNTFEARVTDKIRIVWVKKEDCVYFALLGTHDEVRRFIKQL
jgi:hypothetical protein